MLPCRPALRLLDFAGLDAAGADADALGIAIDERFHRLQVYVPAPLRHIVRVGNVVAELRPLAANITYLCHLNLLQTCLQFSRQPKLFEQLSSVFIRLETISDGRRGE